ncbi:hypothetical protein [Ottowia sp.]|uniref:hypothetical protein n=1 Tax=Ottowia sp. TaxID=1898956 RepID=UPI0025CD5C7C|nr:hypothetical protein [Ottowia sp.]MBK6616247.1 hypothetical protein [Ottowia sp.]
MGSYELHAWRDAMAIAFLLNEDVGAARARGLYEQVPREEVLAYEQKVSEQIEDFIKRSESQRPSVLRKFPNDTTKTTFLVLAILGCLRAKTVMELRDNYRMTLAPGSGNRVTTAAMYAFAEQLRSIFEYEWPFEAFDGMGIDDGEDDEPGGGRVPGGDGGRLEAPAPPPPPSEESSERLAELVLFCGESPAFVIDPDGRVVSKERVPSGKPLWRVLACSHGTGKAYFRLFDAKPDYKPLVRPLVDLLNGFKYPTVGARNAFVATPSAKGLGEVFTANVKADKQVLFNAKAGVGQRAFAKWTEDYLGELMIEFALIGEANPTLAELESHWPQEYGLSYLEFADPTEKRLGRRQVAEVFIRKVCCARGQWPAEMVTAPPATWNPSLHDDDSHKGVEHELRKLEAKRLSPYGEALARIVRLVAEWKRDPSRLDELGQRLGDEIVSWKAGQRLGYSDTPHLSVDLMDFVRSGSLEEDFLSRAVLRRLERPINMASVRVGDGRGRSGVGHAWWGTVSISKAPGGGALRCLPGHIAASRDVLVAMRIEGLLSVDVHPELLTVPTEVGLTGDRSWTGTWGGEWSTPASELLQPLQRGSRSAFGKKEWLRPDAAPGEYRFLVTATARDERSLQEFVSRWSEGAAALEMSVASALAKADVAAGRVSIAPQLRAFMDRYAERSTRVAMLLGKPGSFGCCVSTS